MCRHCSDSRNFYWFFLCTHNGCHTHVSNASSFLSQAELLKRKTAMRCARVKLQIRAGASPFLFGTNPAVSSNQGTSSSWPEGTASTNTYSHTHCTYCRATLISVTLLPSLVVVHSVRYASMWKGCLTLYTGRGGDIQKIGEWVVLLGRFYTVVLKLRVMCWWWYLSCLYI